MRSWGMPLFLSADIQRAPVESHANELGSPHPTFPQPTQLARRRDLLGGTRRRPDLALPVISPPVGVRAVPALR